MWQIIIGNMNFALVYKGFKEVKPIQFGIHLQIYESKKYCSIYKIIVYTKIFLNVP